MIMNLLGLSIITVALNCEKMLEECYSRIAAQDYPKDKIELLIVDGGSTDGTRRVAERWGARVINGGYRDNQEARRYVGFRNASNEILVYIDSDNLITEKDWLARMVKPFMEDPGIVATQTLRYGYEKGLSIMNRYFALFGFNDPVAYYLGKADRLPWFEDRWNLLGEVVTEKEDYYKIRFRPSSLPTIGCNGFLIRKSVFDTLDCRPENFFHTDVNYDIIKKGIAYYGIVKTEIVHATGDTFIKSIKKRMKYMSVHHHELGSTRRYKIFDSANPRDIFNLVKFIIFACTFVEPLYRSFKGFMKIRDFAWFIHPFACAGFIFGYGYSTLLNLVQGSRK